VADELRDGVAAIRGDDECSVLQPHFLVFLLAFFRRSAA
jgi:hypothetical protein